MRIVEDGADAHEFAVALETGDEADGAHAQVRALWASAPDSAGHGVPHALVRCEGGKADTADVRAALARFNETKDNGWRWSVDALAAYVLQELCGIALLDCRYPPTDAAAGTTSSAGGRKR